MKIKINNKDKQKYMKMGQKTFVDNNFFHLLSHVAFAIYLQLRHIDDIKNGIINISISALSLDIGWGEDAVRDGLAELIALNIIIKGKISKNGTQYILNYAVINAYKGRLDTIGSPVVRLREADAIRAEKGLKSINDKDIKKYEGTSFDWDEPKQPKTNDDEENSPQSIINEINQLIANHKKGATNDEDYKKRMTKYVEIIKEKRIKVIKNENGELEIYN